MSNATHPQHSFTGWVSDLARDHSSALARIARAEGLTAEDALDAVQEAFHTLLLLPQARTLVGSLDESRALLAVIVRNAARNMRRRHHRARPHEPAEQVQIPHDEPAVDDVIAHAEEHIRLLGCVSRLGDIQRRVVTLRMLQELSGHEAATTLELPPGHIAVLLHRAKRDLLQCMTE